MSSIPTSRHMKRLSVRRDRVLQKRSLNPTSRFVVQHRHSNQLPQLRSIEPVHTTNADCPDCPWLDLAEIACVVLVHCESSHSFEYRGSTDPNSLILARLIVPIRCEHLAPNIFACRIIPICVGPTRLCRSGHSSFFACLSFISQSLHSLSSC